MKEALSDIPPTGLTSIKEELPEFMMSYKPITTEKAEGSKVKEDSEGSKVAVKKEERVACTSQTDDTPAELNDEIEPVDTASHVTMATPIPISAATIQAAVRTEAAPAAVHEPIRNVSATGRVQPIWLDALIGGLVSLLVALVCRKYVL